MATRESGDVVVLLDSTDGRVARLVRTAGLVRTHAGVPVAVRLFLSTDEDDVELLKMSPFTTLLSDNERDDVIRRSKLRRAESP